MTTVTGLPLFLDILTSVLSPYSVACRLEQHNLFKSPLSHIANPEVERYKSTYYLKLTHCHRVISVLNLSCFRPSHDPKCNLIIRPNHM